MAVLDTFGRPLRYFSSIDDPLLAALKMKKPVIKTAPPVTVAESFTWGVTYSLVEVGQLARFITNGVQLVPVTKLEDLMALKPPVEFFQAFVNVTTVELSEPAAVQARK